VRISLPNLPNEVPTLTTERLALRPLDESDAPSIASIVQLPEVVAALGHDQPRTDEQVLNWVRSLPQSAALSLRYAFAVVFSATLTVVGVVELNPVNVLSRQADLSVWLARDARQRGIGAEASRAVIEWATHTLCLDVNGVANPDNAAAIALMTALGMQDQGELILQSRRRGTVAARVFLSLIHI